MASKVELELQKATGIKPKAKEKVQDYLKRLHGAASELDDDGWKELSTPAQKWANDATKAFDADKPLPEFDAAEEEPKAEKTKGKAKAAEADEEDDASAADAEDETSAEDEADEPADDGESEDKPVSTKTKKKAAAKPAAKEAAAPKKAAAAKEAPAKKKAGTKSSGGVQAVLAHVLRNPDDKVDDIIKALKKDGITVTPSTVSSARGFFKLVVRFLQDRKLTTKKLFD